jgi:hypothetical protein
MEARLEAPDRAQIERQKIEEKSAIRLRGQGYHFAFLRAARVVVHPLQIGGFPAKAGAIVNKLAVNLPSGEVDKRHDFLGN